MKDLFFNFDSRENVVNIFFDDFSAMSSTTKALDITRYDIKSFSFHEIFDLIVDFKELPQRYKIKVLNNKIKYTIHAGKTANKKLIAELEYICSTFSNNIFISYCFDYILEEYKKAHERAHKANLLESMSDTVKEIFFHRIPKDVQIVDSILEILMKSFQFTSDIFSNNSTTQYNFSDININKVVFSNNDIYYTSKFPIYVFFYMFFFETTNYGMFIDNCDNCGRLTLCTNYCTYCNREKCQAAYAKFLRRSAREERKNDIYIYSLDNYRGYARKTKSVFKKEIKKYYPNDLVKLFLTEFDNKNKKISLFVKAEVEYYKSTNKALDDNFKEMIRNKKKEISELPNIIVNRSEHNETTKRDGERV